MHSRVALRPGRQVFEETFFESSVGSGEDSDPIEPTQTTRHENESPSGQSSHERGPFLRTRSRDAEAYRPHRSSAVVASSSNQAKSAVPNRSTCVSFTDWSDAANAAGVQYRASVASDSPVSSRSSRATPSRGDSPHSMRPAGSFHLRPAGSFHSPGLRKSSTRSRLRNAHGSRTALSHPTFPSLPVFPSDQTFTVLTANRTAVRRLRYDYCRGPFGLLFVSLPVLVVGAVRWRTTLLGFSAVLAALLVLKAASVFLSVALRVVR